MDKALVNVLWLRTISTIFNLHDSGSWNFILLGWNYLSPAERLKYVNACR